MIGLLPAGHMFTHPGGGGGAFPTWGDMDTIGTTEHGTCRAFRVYGLKKGKKFHSSTM